jgi:bifunctional glutamyl/prolyl-tRNA synthetase
MIIGVEAGAKQPAAKDQVTVAVNKLLDSKKNFKAKTGQDYDAKKKPTGGASAPAVAKPASVGASGDLALWEEVNKLGTAVRDLKVAKAPKDQVTAADTKLLDGEKNYKAKTGNDYDANKKPAGGAAPAATQAQAPTSASSGDLPLWEKVTQLGDAVLQRKSAKASKDQVTAAVNKLLEGKKEFKAKTGADYDAKKKLAAGAPVAPASASVSSGALAAREATTAQGNAVRYENDGTDAQPIIDAINPSTRVGHHRVDLNLKLLPFSTCISDCIKG